MGGLQAIGSTAVQGGQCGLDSSCGIHNAQDAWGTLSANPEAALGSAWSQGVDAAKSGLSQLAYAGADMADKFEACKARNDYIRFGQESSQLFVNTEGTGLSLPYGGKGLVSLAKSLPAAVGALPAAARAIPSLIKSLPARLLSLPSTAARAFNTIGQSVRAFPQALRNLGTTINQEVRTPGGGGWTEVWHHNDFLRGGPGSVTKQNVPSWYWDSIVTSPTQTRLSLPWRLATARGHFPSARTSTRGTCGS